jgi:hypothetical protein
MGGPERRSLPLYGRYGIYEAAHCGIRCFLFGLNIRFQHAFDILALVDDGVLIRNPEGGRSTSYSLAPSQG